MTREIKKSQKGRFDDDRSGRAGPVVLLISDGRDDWMLPDEAFADAGCRLLRTQGFPKACETGDLDPPDLVFMPLTLEGKLTNDQLVKCLAQDPAPVVVVVASNDQINTAAEAMRLGAYDCLFRPFSRSRLVRTIEAAVKKLKQVPPNPKPATRPSRPMPAPQRARAAAPAVTAPKLAEVRRGIDSLNLSRRGFVASSPRMRAVLEKAAIVAQSDATVFISGEVGTGKSTFAGIVHEVSPRAFHPLVTLSCATLTAQTFESQTFGPHGALARATGGTLYLDEITDLPDDVQPKVTRILDNTEAGVAGPGVRVIVSTGHAPDAALRNGLIRPELYYRLRVAPLDLPPLRDREGDPEMIARVRLTEFCEAEGRNFNGFSDTALAMIARYDWPGNLRELINVIQTIVLMNEGPLITPEHFPPEIRAGLRPVPAPSSELAGRAPHHAAQAGDTRPDTLVGKTLAQIERTVIEATIAAENGSVPRAARVLDVSPSTLYRKREAWSKASED